MLESAPLGRGQLTCVPLSQLIGVRFCQLNGHRIVGHVGVAIAVALVRAVFRGGRKKGA
jgi:hypothetical protein